MKRLYVLYKSGLKFTGPDYDALSFMQPDDEYRTTLLCPSLLFGRKEMDAVREKARTVYVGTVARIAATPCDGKTLRQALEIPGMGNPWWYHPVSEKQAESDNTFNTILQIFTVLNVAEREKTEEIVLYGAPVCVVHALRSRYKTIGLRCHADWNDNMIRAFLARARYLFNSLRSYTYIRHRADRPAIRPDVVFHGYWDWSVGADGRGRKVEDKYFRSLPAEFEKKKMSCAWFLWLDPRRKYGLPGDPRFVFVQKFLNVRDILSIVPDLRPFWRYIRFSRSDKFRRLFVEDSYDLWPLFRRKLLYGFCGPSMPHHFLMETAYARAFAFYKPGLSFTFLELFLSSRAFNQAAASGSPATVRCDMQHAACAREKTFALADPFMEFGGRPDDKPMPFPGIFFVMGELYRDILLENGVSAGNIFVTGSGRFDGLTQAHNGSIGSRRRTGPARILIVSTVNVRLDFEMVRASYLASRGLDIELRLRSHPLKRIEDIPEYKQYSKGVVSSVSSLQEDLKRADLVLFTYSTVAEEAFLKDIPVLRWQANGFNGSVFRDIGAVPSAYSVESLKRQFITFLEDPLRFMPDGKIKELVLNKCFHKTDGLASCRIAEKAAELLARR